MEKSKIFPYIAHYLRHPAVDCSGGESLSDAVISCQQQHLILFREGSIRSLVGYRFDNPEYAKTIWDRIAPGGYLLMREITDNVLHAFGKITRYRVMEREPMVVVQKLQNGKGCHVQAVEKDYRKRVCLVRWGAYGDMVMMTPLIDHFKDRGYHVTLNTTKKGMEVLFGDPRIDRMMYLEDGIAPTDLKVYNNYMDTLSKMFDEMYNVSGAVEESLLLREGYDPAYGDPWEIVHAKCNKNYMDNHFSHIGLPVPSPPIFPTVWLSEKEKEWARREVEEIRNKLGKSFIFLWHLMGSTFHKLYPGIYDVWTLVDHNKDDIGFITSSDSMGQFLEDFRYKCVSRRSGKYTVRQTMAIHSAVDGVVTPETLSLSVGLAFPAPVIALLSHSSKEQFYWRPQDIPLYPKLKDCHCYPCHKIHYSRLVCPRGNFFKDATLCMDSITPAEVYQALLKIRGVSLGDDAIGTADQG